MTYPRCKYCERLLFYKHGNSHYEGSYDPTKDIILCTRKPCIDDYIFECGGSSGTLVDIPISTETGTYYESG